MSRHGNSAAARVMGTFLLILAVVCLGMGYGARKTGVFGMLFLFAGAYLTIHGTGLWLEGDGTLTFRKAWILLGVLAFLGLFIWFTSLDASIWG
jgi:hypothetical protein